MRSTFINTAALTLSLLLIPWVAPPLHPLARAETSAARVVLQVEGMTCEDCARKVRTTLLQLDGVNEARVSFDEMQADVAYDSNRVSTSDIRDTIEQLGYQVTRERRAESHGDDRQEKGHGQSSSGCCQ